MPPSAAEDDMEQVSEDVVSTQQGPDVEMAEEHDITRGPEVEETTSKDEQPPRMSFVSYLSSPVVTLVVGQDDSQSLLTAHQALLCKSPYFQELCQRFVDDGSPRQIDLLEDVSAVGSFLEFLYTGEYFPRKIHGQRVLEVDPDMPKVDDTGVHLLKHARIYTLAEKYGVPDLKKLSSSKIHCIDSTAKGEIEYARYVYAHTTNDDTKVRAPIASFWATRSHTLRAEAEGEFKSLCLEYPQFGYDVLTRVLNEKLKRERMDKMHPSAGSGRKRARHSSSAAGSVAQG
ncbi:BTB/POZ fold protein [Metarhizium album ARSEF 1941]|uniref:BTB/POZ fold protein n=1 Tax=Metarhizium album (strain ARSEF 1941) TaxID=1081103 RepID=A0A0B2X089_METAS|nr:BTB/POZ fold protein [Metarhizium album ARSEF 1941]KHN99708.1 BTB/POZ fold protein [Metarhizium album ARSEF 1941]